MAFGFYKACTIQTGQVPSSQSNFPALLPFIAGDADFATVANGGKATSSSGYDIRPYSDSGLTTALTYELVPGTYVAGTGAFEMWVNMTAADATVVYMGIGDSGITTDGSSNSTWPSQYKGVWHFSDGTTLSLNDSTSNALNASYLGADHAISVAGKIDGCAQVAHTDDGITFGTGAVPTTGSMSFWFYPTWPQTDASIHDLGLYVNLSDSEFFMLEKYADNAIYAGWYNGSEGRVVIASANYTLTQNAWNHLALTWDHTAPATKAYLNGSQIGSTNTTNGTWNTAGSTLYSLYNTAHAAVGGDRQDELHLLNSVLTANWITTEYNNQNNLGTFWSKGSITAFSGGTPSPGVTDAMFPGDFPTVNLRSFINLTE